MSWIGGRLTSLTGQISNLTKDILTEGTEEVSDHVTELRLAQDRNRELDTLCIHQKEENDRLKQLVREWEVKAESSELQINSISREYRAVLAEREAEIKQLKQQHHENQELKVSYLAGESAHPAVLDLNTDGFESVGYQGGDEHDFGENIAMQHEINRLRGDVQRLQAQCEHWKKLVNQNTSNNANGETGDAEDKGENQELLKQLQELQQQVGHEKDVRQHELSSLQDAHSHKISTLRKRHKEEVAELQQKIAELDWGSEGWQTQAPDESISLKQTITSLQEEVARLRLEREDHLQQIAGLNSAIDEQTGSLAGLNDTVELQTSELAISQARTLHLENQVKVSKAEIDRLLADHEQADALEILSDLREVRQQMDTGAIDRRHKLLEEKDKLINQMIVSGHKKRVLTDSVALFEGEQKRLKEEASQMVSELGDTHRQELTAEIIDSIEKENLLLRKRNVTLQEQVTLLERAIQNVTKEKMVGERNRQGETQSVSADSGSQANPDSDTFSDTMSFTSDLSELSRRNMELDEQVDSLRCQIGKYESEIEKFELNRMDWQSEKSSLEDVLLQLRGQLKDKENSLTVIEAQKGLAEAVIKGSKFKKAWEPPSHAEKVSNGLIAVEKQEHSQPASSSGSDNETIMEDVIKLDNQVGLLTEANAQLEFERDELLEEKETMQRDLAELRAESQSSRAPNGDADDLNNLLQDKEKELQVLMEEAEDMKRDLAEVPNLKLKLQETQHEVKNLQKGKLESVSNNTAQEMQILKNSVSAMEQELMRLKQEKVDNELLGQEVDGLKQKIRNKNEEIVNLSLEKEDLMSSLEELDTQHEEAMSKIIVIRNELSTANEDLTVKLASSETESQELRSELQLVKQQQLVDQSIETSDSNELNHQIAELKEDNLDVTQRMNDYYKRISELEANMDEKEKRSTEMNEKLVSSAAALNNLHMDKQESTGELHKLKDEVGSKIAKIKELNKDKAALMQENNGLKLEIKSIHETHEESQQLLKEYETKNSKNEVNDLVSNIESLKFEVGSKDKQYYEIQNRLQCHVEENENITDRLLKTENDYKSVCNEKVELDNEVCQLKGTISEKEALCSELCKDLEASQKDCQILSAQSARKCAECESFSTQLHMHEGELHKLTTELSDRDEAITSFSSQLDAVKEESSLKESKYASVESELESVKELLKDATDKLHTKCEECNELTAQLDMLQNELRGLKNNADSQAAELNSLNAQVLSATGELVLLKEELRNKSDEYDVVATEMTNLNDELSAAKNDQGQLLSENKKLVIDCDILTRNCTKLDERLKECTDDFRAQIQKLEKDNDQLISEKEKLENDIGALENKLTVQTGHYESYITELKSNKEMDTNTLQSEYSALVEESHQKDLHISELVSQVSVLEGKLKDIIESAVTYKESNKKLSDQLHEKDNELKSLKSLHSQCSQQILLKSALVETLNKDKEKLVNEIQGLNDGNNNSGLKMKEMENLLSNSVPHTVHSELIKEKEDLCDKVKELLSDVSHYTQIIKDHEAGISDLNQKCSKQTAYIHSGEEMVKSLEGIIEVLRQSCVQKDTEISMLQRKLIRAKSFVDEIHHDKIDSEYDSASPNYHLPALEYKETEQVEEVEVCETVQHLGSEVNQHEGRQQLKANDSQKLWSDNTFDSLGTNDLTDVDVNHAIEVTKEIDKLRNQLGEKDSVIAELQRNNSLLLKMFETKSKSSQGDAALLEVHKLENEVRVLRLEREQIMDVMNEKSRECSNLKTEVHRLMNVVSAENEALAKLQIENQELVKQSPEKDNHSEHIDEMQKDVVKNLSRLIRDKDLEIESLSQKNQTLLQVMQESSHEGTQINALMQDKENLSKQVTALQAEREAMITFLNQKHQESLAYHNEVQRLTAIVNTETEKNKLVKHEYESLVPKFEDKQQALVKSQNDLLNYKQKFTELEVKYGQLLQQSNVEETVDRATFDSKAEEALRLQERYKDILDSVKEKELKIQNLHQNINDLESNLRSVKSERGSYKKQVDNFVFQLHGLQTEQGDLKSEIAQLNENKTGLLSECQLLKETNNKLTLQLQDRDFEIRSLHEKVATQLVQENQGEKGQLDNLVKENEATQKHIQHMQQERDHAVMALQQKQEENEQLLRDIHMLNDKEGRLKRELDRLRGHLIQIEDGYTRDALASEEREKDLRNRLSVAEEMALSSSNKVENAGQLSSQQIDSLQQQLQFVSGQRDQAYLQLSTLQEQNQVYTVSMANLQMVLEQFQQEKENIVAQETESYEKQVKSLSNQVEKLQIDLAVTKGQLDEASDGLEAAARLSAQLDRKEEAIDTLREEVHVRDSALKAATQKLHKLTSRSDDKVDKLVIKNLLLGYFTAIQDRRHDVLRAIGGVLMFSPEDYEKVEGAGKGWVPGFLKFGGGGGRSPSSPPSTPTRRSTVTGPTPARLNNSFSEMFVRFLERESSPPPPAVRLPAEAMVRDVQKQKEAHKPAYNPFTAPRHVSLPIQTTQNVTSSPLLMGQQSPGISQSMPTFATPAESSQTPPGSGRSTPASSSAILKDVLNTR